MPGEHSYFSPSASPRWLACPGSLALSEGIEESTSPYAHEGTVCHEVAARCLKENLIAEDFSGETIEGVFMAEDLIEAIQMYVDEVRGQAKELGVRGGKIEHTVSITEDCWGTLDAMMWNNEQLLVADAKFGKGVIVDGDTPQMKVYAIGALKWLQIEHGLAPQKIKTVIIQPRTVNPIRPVEYTRAELVEWYKKTLIPTMEAVRNGAVKCVPGETQCRWCPAAGVCTVQAEYAIREAARAFKPYTEVEKPAAVLTDPSDCPTLTLRDMADLKKSFRFIEDWMGSINSILMERALEGETIPGFKLVEGRSNRKWKADENQIAAFLLDAGVDAYKEVLKTPPAVEKEIGKKKAKAIGLESYISKPPGSPTLVDESDKRPEMSLNVEQEFEEFVESGPVIVETATSGSQKEDEFDDEPRSLTLMQRLAMAYTEEDSQDAESATKNDGVLEDVGMFAEAAGYVGTGGDEGPTVPVPVSPGGGVKISEKKDVTVVQTAAKSENPVAPKKTTKRHTVLSMGRGGASLEEVAKVLNCGVNSVKMHIRYLHERDGFGYELYSDETFKILD